MKIAVNVPFFTTFVIPANFKRESTNNRSPTKDFGDDRNPAGDKRLPLLFQQATPSTGFYNAGAR